MVISRNWPPCRIRSPSLHPSGMRLTEKLPQTLAHPILPQHGKQDGSLAPLRALNVVFSSVSFFSILNTFCFIHMCFLECEHVHPSAYALCVDMYVETRGWVTSSIFIHHFFFFERVSFTEPGAYGF